MELLLFTSTALHEHGEHPEILCGVHITIYISQNCAFLSAYMQRLLHFRCVFCVCVLSSVPIKQMYLTESRHFRVQRTSKDY